jgi:osmotically-inducible protein OsmY
LVGLLLLTACATQKSTETTPAPAFRALGEAVAVEPTYSDESIGFEARRRVDLAGPVEMAGVRIQVEAGIVTLLGSVPDRAAAWRAEGAVRSVPGVKNVINELQFSIPGPK